MSAYVVDTVDGAISFECRDTVSRVLQNVKNLLMTRRGECCFDRQRGLDPALFDLPEIEMRQRLMPEIDRVLLWEPRADAARAEVYRDANGTVRLRVTVEIEE